MAISELLPSLFAAVLAAMLAACLTWAIRPLLLRYALAKPNARSSHSLPTSQGAVIAATLLVAAATIASMGSVELGVPVVVFGATLFIAVVGFADDIKHIPVIPRLILEKAAP
jgi:UDP-N-acetylmuramyl pentapeptide phosphotransferase/UDP-N-acetylglucosamine-1-phosphate transferase